MSAKFFGISKEAAQAAEAATSFDILEPQADSGVPYKENVSNDGKVFKRWTESVTIVKASSKETKIGKDGNEREVTQFYVQLRFGPNGLNKGRVMHSRQNMNFDALRSGSGDDGLMNNFTIAYLQSLFDAVGIPTPAGISAELMAIAFPEDGGAGTSNLVAKRAKVTLCGSERKDGKGRQVQVEEYLPEA